MSKHLVPREEQSLMARWRPKSAHDACAWLTLLSGFIYFTLLVSPLFQWRIIGAVPLTIFGLACLVFEWTKNR